MTQDTPTTFDDARTSFLPITASETLQSQVQALTEQMLAEGHSDKDIIFNFNATTGEIPHDYEFLIHPIKSIEPDKATGKSRVINVGLTVGAIPTVAHLLSSVDGQAWVTTLVRRAIADKFTKSFKTQSRTLPYAPAQYWQVAGRDDHYKSFMVLIREPKVRDAFKRVAPSADIKQLINILSSQSFANTVAKSIEPAKWVMAINFLKSTAQKWQAKDASGEFVLSPLDTALFDHWIATRETTDVDLTDGADFDSVFA